jgi:hypothetical protein
LIYLLAKKLYDKNIGLLATLIFAIDLPYVVEISRWGYDLSYITPFVTLGVYFLTSFYKDTASRNLKLVLSGFFLGTASIMKLYALPVVGVVFLVLLFESFRKKHTLKELRSFTIKLGFFFLGFAIIPIITLAFVFSINAWDQYVFTLQNGRLITLSLTEKIGRFSDFVNRLLPMLLLSIPEILFAFFVRKTHRLITALWLLIPAASVFFIPNFIDSTLNYTAPAVMILASATVIAVGKKLWTDIKMHPPSRDKLVDGLIVLFVVIIIVQSFANYQSWGNFLYSDNPRVAGQAEVANFIRDNTSPSDAIFTTDVSLAVLAQRSVIKVGDIKVSGFYSDLFGYDGTKYVGVSGYPQGIITPTDVLQAIQTQKPRLVVLTKTGSGTFAAVDYLIFNGDPEWNNMGIGPWLERNYIFLKQIENSYGTFDIWTAGNPRTLMFEDFEGNNYSSTGKLLTIETFGEKTSYSLNQERNQPIFGSHSARINYTLSGGEHSYVRLGVKTPQPTDLSSFNAIAVQLRGNETTTVFWFDIMDAQGNFAGAFGDDLKIAGLINLIVPLSIFDGVDLSRISEIWLSLDNNSQSHEVSGTVDIYEITLIG